MNSELKALVEGVLNDLIEARLQADLTLADLAEHYRDHPGLSSMHLPALNISSVDVDLRFIVEQPEAAAETEESATNTSNSAAAADSFVKEIAEFTTHTPAFAAGTIKKADREKLSESLTKKLGVKVKSLNTSSPVVRRMVMEEELVEQFKKAKIEPNEEQRKEIKRAIAKADVRYAIATRSPKLSSPLVKTTPEALAKAQPEAISRISFTVDLSPKRWLHNSDDDSAVLSDD